VGSIPASRTNFFKTNGSESSAFWAIFLCLSRSAHFASAVMKLRQEMVVRAQPGFEQCLPGFICLYARRQMAKQAINSGANQATLPIVEPLL
jgi:hypothetical protein